MKKRIDYFAESPFALLANKEAARCWAGRPGILGELKRLSSRILNRPDSTIDLLWANLGAGKTHALLHFQQLLESSANEHCYVAYVEVPEGISKFLELYKALIVAVPLRKMANHAINGSCGGSLMADALHKASRAIVHGGSTEREIAIDWLSGGRPHLRELRTLVGVDQRIDADVQAIEVFSSIVAVLGAKGIRVVILLDEFQRLGVLKSRIREALLSGVRTVFSRNPKHFSLVVATGSRIEKTAVDLIPKELRTLMGMRPTISLPEMNESDSLEFILGRLKCFRPEHYSGSAAAPFTEETLTTVVTTVKSRGEGRLIPRVLLQICGFLYDDLLEGEQLTEEYVKNRLENLSWGMLEIE